VTIQNDLLKDVLDGEYATAGSVGDMLKLAQELAEAGAEVLTLSEGNVHDAEARKRLAQALMLLELAGETVAAAGAAHNRPAPAVPQ